MRPSCAWVNIDFGEGRWFFEKDSCVPCCHRTLVQFFAAEPSRFVSMLNDADAAEVANR